MYLGYQNDKVKFYVEQPLNPNFYNVDRWVETQGEYVLEGDEYVIMNEDWEERERQRERERIGNLNLTKRVFVLCLQKLGITYSQLKDLIATNEQAQLEWDLCVKLERKNPLLDLLANSVGITSEQLDKIFIDANKEVHDDNVV